MSSRAMPLWSRREFLVTGTGAAAGLFLLGACGPEKTKAQLKGLAAEGILRWDTEVEATNINPIGPTNQPAVRRVGVWTHNALLRPTDKPGEYVPDLAVEVPKSQQDGLLYEIKLRQDVTWHDGSPLAADDVVATYRAVQDPTYGSIWRSHVQNTLGSVEAVDRNTVRFQMVKPDTLALNFLAVIMIVKASEAQNKDLLAKKPTGTGPFKVGDVRSGDRIVLEPYPGHFRKGLPKVKAIHYVVTADASARTVNLINGETALTSDVPYGQIQTLGSKGVTVHDVKGAPARTIYYVGTSRPELRDINLRRALAYAIDRQQIVDTVYKGYAAIGQGGYGPNSLFYDPSITLYGARPDLTKARTFLAQAPKLSKPLVLTFPTQSTLADTATILQSNWKALGIEVEIEPLAVAAAISKLVQRRFELWMGDDFSGTGPGFTPSYMLVTYKTGSASNRIGVSDPELDRQIDIAAGSTDPQKAAAAYRFIQKYDLDYAGTIATCYPHYVEAQGVPLSGYSPSRLGNVPYNVEKASIG